MSVDNFRSNDSKSPRWCCWCGDPYDVRKYDIATITNTSCRGRHVIGGICDVLEWCYLADPGSFL